MSGRVGRDRFRRDQIQHPHSSSSSSSRFDDNKSSSRGKIPPSRHLWVGNLSHHIVQSTITDQFIRFGELESVAFQPGRSYAFVNFVRQDDAMAAVRSLQGFNLAGMPLRIEFAKADKSSTTPRNENYLQHRDELHTPNRSSAYSPRDSRIRHGSPDTFLPDSSRASDDNTEHPSEILWIGYPSFMKVDETILRKAFSPFGEIDKITAFPGRTYAFVKFRNISSACRAKSTLQGKLFGNPRVHICFARSDNAPPTGGRRGLGPNAPLSPHLKPNGQAGSSDNFRSERNFGNLSRDPSVRQPRFLDPEYRDHDIVDLGRKEPSWTYELRPPQYRNSPRDENIQFQEFSPPRFPRKNPFPEEPWDAPEDPYNYHGAKKLKIGPFPHDKELPEYPFDNPEDDKHVFSRMAPNFPQSDETRPLPYRRLTDHLTNLNQPLGDARDNWKSSHDTFQSPPPPLSSMPVEWKRMTPEFNQRPMKEEWKWEGTIAKGGTPVCRARCFPVGKVMDIFLPEILDCTARTGLDMLAKHYYQAASSWVVFFVAASDADMGYYNEFMHYLGEKQRAAVAKLDEKNTLFLVPPSDFSENILKVPGKLSLSGVVLRLEPASPSGGARIPPINEMKDTSNLMYSHADNSYDKSELLSGQFHSLTSYLEQPGRPRISSPSLRGNTSSAPSPFPGYGLASGSVSDHMSQRHEFEPSHRGSIPGPTGPPRPPQTSVPSSMQHSTSQAFPVTQDYHHSVSSSRGGQEPNRGNYESGFSGISYLPPGGNSFFGSSGEEFRSPSVMGNQPKNSSEVQVPPRFPNQVSSELSNSQFAQPQQMPASTGSWGNQELLNTGSAQDEGEADPQKRLQATLQLAAALLQQIQQGKGS